MLKRPASRHQRDKKKLTAANGIKREVEPRLHCAKKKSNNNKDKSSVDAKLLMLSCCNADG